ncbi:MAG TPA: hypothetical protein VHE60_03415 [Pyrinomonadaceae bacterium]|nr:hypothetical protein [Pyrinomonadaceae bacterium]
MRALRVVALPSAAVAGACVQAVSVASLIPIGAVAIPTVIRRVVNASAFVDAIAISIAIPITIPISVTVSTTMTIAVTIPIPIPIAITITITITVAVAISIPGEV